MINLHRKQEEYTDILDSRGYYFIDNSSEKIRYVVLNTCEITNTSVSFGITPYIRYEQLKWLGDVALNVPTDDWHVFVIGHVPMASDMSGYSEWVQKAEVLLSAYQEKAVSDSITVNDYAGESHTFTIDFSNYKGVLIGYICGHNHLDEDSDEDGVLSISTTSDAMFNTDGYGRSFGTTSESAFDVVGIDKANQSLSLIRVGAGNNRSFIYPPA